MTRIEQQNRANATEREGNLRAPDSSDQLRKSVQPELLGFNPSGARSVESRSDTAHSEPFDSKRTLSDLVKTGAIKDISRGADQTLEFSDLNDRTPPKVSVDFTSNTDSGNPTFRVRNDGTIEMSGDPEKLNTKNISIQVERSDGQIYPNPEQQEQLNKLVSYLSERLKVQYPDLAKTGLEVTDANALVASNTRQKLGLRQPAENDGNTPETQQSIGSMNRFRGGKGGEMPVSDTRQYYPDRTVPKQPNESTREVAIKEAAAGLFNADREKPYETIRKHPQGDNRLGRYGLSGHQIEQWLSGLDLGTPPDPAKINELIKQGKLPQGFNAGALKALQDLASKAQNGTVSSEDLKTALPKELQESIATDLVKSFGTKFGDSPGAIAAAMLTGKNAAEISQRDLDSPSAKQSVEAGQRLFDIASARQQATQPNETVKWGADGRVTIGNGKWLNDPAAQALAAAKADAAAHGVPIQVNSAGRTFEEQSRLYANRGTAGISSVVAKPGTSNHESGMALDVQNYAQAKPYLLKYGFVHGDGRGVIQNDPVHFKFTGGNRNA
ncbi:MAG TPA: M15 family metallopeptidase [Drouetiella sp.]